MDATRFKVTEFGGPTRRPGDRWAFDYYLPAPIPRSMNLDESTVLALSEADNALGLLNGIGRLIPQADLLLGPFLTREALASSRIEGTKASLVEVLKAEEVEIETKSDDVAEVERYLEATRIGLELIKTLPITQRLIKQTHAALMQGVRGDEKEPGAIRSTPVWIGSVNATPDTARFVPPLPEHLPDLLADWERFTNESSRLPTLVRCALMHYQFETIHPFLDGNGRIGRLLVGLMLISEHKLSRPFLYLSGYLESNRAEYYDRLQAVRESGDIQSWLQFFLVAVLKQSEDAVSRAGKLVELREKYYEQSRMERSRVAALIPLIFTNPFLSVKRVQRGLGVTTQGARLLLEKAVSHGWVTQLEGQGYSGRHLWISQGMIEIIDGPLSY